MATATKTTPETMVCMEAHCSPASQFVITYESEWPADDPVVQAAPHLFTSKSTPRGQWRTPFDTAVQTNDQKSREAEQARKDAFEQAAKANAVKLEPVKLLTAKKDIVCELDGVPTTLRKGSQLAANHPVVLEHQESFA